MPNIPPDDPLSALRQAADSQSADVEQEFQPQTVAQRKAATKQKAAKLTGSPIVAFSLWAGVMLAAGGGLLFVRNAVTSQNAAESTVADTTDYKNLYEKEKNLRTETEQQKEDLLRNQIDADLSVKTKPPVVPAPVAVAPRPIATPAPVQNQPTPPPREVIIRREPVVRVALVRKNPQQVLAGSIMNDQLPPFNLQTEQDRVRQRFSLTAHRVMATRMLNVRLISRVQYVGSNLMDLPVQAEVTKDVLVNGNVAVPAGSLLLGHLTKVDSNGFVEIAFERGRLPGDDGLSFSLQAIAVDEDGGVLVAQAPRRPDPGGADALSIGTSFLSGFSSAGLTQVQQNSGFAGSFGQTITSSTANNPFSEGMRQASSQATSILGRSAAEARQVARSGNLDFFLNPGKPFKVLLLSDMLVPNLEN